MCCELSVAIPGTAITDIGAGAAQAMGRYFSVISVVPSAFYVIFVYLLIASGSWTGSPDWGQAFAALEHPGISGFAFLAFLSIGLGIVIHPIQFAIVQLLEGYWGTNPMALAVRSRRITHYQKTCEKLEYLQESAYAELNNSNTDVGESNQDRIRLYSQYVEARRARDADFPALFREIMPTRLGNKLRLAESQAGSQYGMNALQAVPHLLMIAPQEQVSYVNDQRTLLDLAVRMTFLSAVATGTAVLFLWPYGLWALVAVLPYGITYLSYRGAVTAAGHYGSALSLLINLNRFRLYEELHLPLPATTVDERELNEALSNLFAFDPDEDVRYKHPAASEVDEEPPNEGPEAGEVVGETDGNAPS
jgi:hypothetical protein